MPSRGEINSDKILVKDIFSRMWFRIPEYQRPYVWGYEEISDLLDDLVFALREKPDFEYFLGSFVFQSKIAAPEKGEKFDENDILDGQQRMTTLLLLFAVIRDLTEDNDAKSACQECVYQKPSKFRKIPERTRLVFAIREAVQDFINSYVKTEGATGNIDELSDLSESEGVISVQNMAKAVLQIREYFQNDSGIRPEDFLEFLLNKVLLIYVSTEDLEDAFRLFMILNDRGIPLRNSDILKSMNLGILDTTEEKIKYAKMWEEAEGELGDDFDRFLNHVRTILVKDKARLSLLQEFEDKIYAPKEKDKSTGKPKPVLLRKGRDTFELIERYLGHYRSLLAGQNYDKTGSFEFDNLIKVMLTGLPATDWVPPLLRYFDKFGHDQILEFLRLLDIKFSADWIGQRTPTHRIEAMNQVIRVIESVRSAKKVLDSECFDIDDESLFRIVEGPVYGKRFTRYALLILDYLYHNHDLRMHFETLSVEHILPQNPEEKSQWCTDFTDEQREEWTDKIGNLILITRRKNSSLGRLDYSDKKKQYFTKCIDTCPNSLRVLNKYDKWTPDQLLENHEIVLNDVRKHYGVT